MPEFPIPLPTASVFEDAAQYIPLLITAVDEFLVNPSLWAEEDYPTAYGYMQDLILWLQFLLETQVKIIESYVNADNGAEFLLETLPAGATVLTVVLAVDVPFEAGVTISVGTPDNHELLMATGENAPQAAYDYTSQPNHEFSAETTIYLYINGTVVDGRGRLYLTLEGA